MHYIWIIDNNEKCWTADEWKKSAGENDIPRFIKCLADSCVSKTEFLISVKRYEKDIECVWSVSPSICYEEGERYPTGYEKCKHLLNIANQKIDEYNNEKTHKFSDFVSYKKLIPNKVNTIEDYFPALGAVYKITETINGSIMQAYIPDFIEMHTLFDFISDINNALEVCGAEPIEYATSKDSKLFWTSSEDNQGKAIYFNKGYVGDVTNMRSAYKMTKCNVIPMFKKI